MGGVGVCPVGVLLSGCCSVKIPGEQSISRMMLLISVIARGPPVGVTAPVVDGLQLILRVE